MNEAVNIVFGNGFGYPFCAFDMDVFKIEIPRTYQYEAFCLFDYSILGGVIPSNKVVDDIRMSNAFFEGRGISKIVFLQRVLAATYLIKPPKDPP